MFTHFQYQNDNTEKKLREREKECGIIINSRILFMNRSVSKLYNEWSHHMFSPKKCGRSPHAHASSAWILFITKCFVIALPVPLIIVIVHNLSESVRSDEYWTWQTSWHRSHSNRIWMGITKNAKRLNDKNKKKEFVSRAVACDDNNSYHVENRCVVDAQLWHTYFVCALVLGTYYLITWHRRHLLCTTRTSSISDPINANKIFFSITFCVVSRR